MALLKSNTIIYGTANIQSVLTVGAVTPNNSISSTTGSLIVYGGVGITGNVYANSVYANGLELYSYSTSAYSQANVTAGGLVTANANTVYLSGALNSANANIALLFAIDTSQNTNIISLQTQANTLLPNTGSLITVNGSSQLVISNTSTSAVSVAGGIVANTIAVGQNYNGGTGTLQVTGNTSTTGSTVSQNIYLAGGNNLIPSTNLQSNWAIGAGSVSSKQSDPYGNTNAFLVTTTGFGGFYYQGGENIVGAGITYTFSIYAKAGTLSNLTLQLGLTSTVYIANFNVATGTTSTASGTGTSSIVSVGNNWYRCIITAVSTSSGSTGLAQVNYTSAGTYYFFGPQVEIGTIASPYTPTNGTAISTLNNLYIPTDSAIGIGTVSPNAAIHIVQDGSTGPGNIPTIILDNPSTAGSTSTYATALLMRVSGGGAYTQSGIINDWYGNYYTSGTNITLGHGMNYVAGRSGQANHQFRNYSNTTQAIITDSSQSGSYYAQSTMGAIFTNQYIAGQNWLIGGYNTNLQITGNTVANGVATIQNIVVQGQNNLFTYSNDFTQSVWQKSNTIINSSTGYLGPDNITSSQSVTANQATGNGSIYRTTTVSNLNGYYSFSFYVAANTSGMTNIYATLGTGNNYTTNTTFSFPFQGNNPVNATFISQNGVVANTASVYRVNGYYRCTITGLLYDPTGSGIIRTDILVPTNATSNASVYVWGTQLEQGQQSSNYTPTGATAITTNNNLYAPTGNVQAVSTVISNKVNWVNSNNTSVMYQYYNSATNSYDLVFG